jgi:hypothetical protein
VVRRVGGKPDDVCDRRSQALVLGSEHSRSSRRWNTDRSRRTDARRWRYRRLDRGRGWLPAHVRDLRVARCSVLG